MHHNTATNFLDGIFWEDFRREPAVNTFHIGQNAINTGYLKFIVKKPTTIV
ncbi:hypothetical protein PM8797T_18024 [Gimesia maris DSM 8797]|nr:hypothetical protein PM8797T_18024 [Gimesia maris DSM 8797]